MNKRYFLLILIFGIATANIQSAQPDSTNYIEKEKDLEKESVYSIINRNMDFYEYTLSFGTVAPTSSYLNSVLTPGNCISFMVKTPYRTPIIMNRYDFNTSFEISIKTLTASDYNYGILSTYLLLDNNDNNDSDFKFFYGLGFAQLSGKEKVFSPCFKGKAEYQLDLNKAYLSLVNYQIINENKDISYFLNKINLSIGCSPEFILGYPSSSGDVEFKIKTFIADIYLRVNLFNL